MHVIKIKSISDNCLRESTLWLSGYSIGLLPGRPGFDSERRHRKFFSYALLCYGYNVVRLQ